MRVPLQKAYQSVCTFVSSEKFQLSLVATVKTYLTFFSLENCRSKRRTMSTSNDEESNRLRTSRCRSKAQPVAKRALVDHTYVDHKHDPIAPANGPVSHGRGGVTVAFPEKLHEMLNSMEEENLEHIVSWQPHGRCFQVHKKTEFIEMVMPRYVRYKPLRKPF